jgi:hypothetical protein
MKKKLFSLFVVLVGLAFITEANAQMSKAMQKACKAKTKELTKGGWAIMGSSYTLDMALAKHYEKLDGKQEVFGTAISTQKNIGTAKLQQDAIEKYTTQIGMSIKGRVTTQHGSQVSSDAMEEIDLFLQGFDGKVQAELKGELKLSYMIYRQTKQPNGKPCYEFEGYFIVDIEEAHQARMKAFQQMLAESRAHQKIAKETAEWINEAFEAEQAELLQVTE